MKFGSELELMFKNNGLDTLPAPWALDYACSGRGVFNTNSLIVSGLY